MPDRMFLLDGRVLFIEFKKPGEKPSRIQRWTLNDLRSRGFDAIVVDDVEEGKKLTRRYVLGWSV
jgi:hypothetical protein